MYTFKDELGREWNFRLTIQIAEEIFKRCERPDSTPSDKKYYDLLSIVDSEQPQYYQPFVNGRIDLNRAAKLVNLFYVVCEKQCKERKISEQEFGELMAGETFGNCLLAFQEALLNFIPKPEFRELVQTILTTAGGVDSTALVEVNKRFAALETARVAGISSSLEVRMRPFETAVIKEVERMQKESEEIVKEQEQSIQEA
jgi:hypothetical protein